MQKVRIITRMNGAEKVHIGWCTKAAINEAIRLAAQFGAGIEVVLLEG